NLLFCVASGGSPSGTYAKLADFKSQHPNFGSDMRVIKLDEWGGLEVNSPFTSELDVQRKFVQPMGISPERYWSLDPYTQDPEEECSAMEQVLEREGPLDICILGFGVNGHIALNEPGEEHQLPFHVCQLAESTLANGMLKTLRHPPKFGMTIGMRGILQSRLIILFVSGVHEILVNRTGSAVMQKNIESLGAITYTEEEQAFAKKIQEANGKPQVGVISEIKPMEETQEHSMGGSTDVGDVSWVVPTIRMGATVAPTGTPWHSWAVVASVGMSIGHKGMAYASKALAMTMVDLYQNETLRNDIKAEFKQKKGDYSYKGILPDGPPPLKAGY
uniref:6-phosphogluconolactonase n=1 Tax=Algoriphagus sp. TaxID=1872435 RepID=UPI004047E6B3